MIPPFFMSLDCEAIGLHGETFVVGFTVVNTEGRELACGGFQCPPDTAKGTDEGREWVKANVPDMPFAVAPDPAALRSEFWLLWSDIKEVYPGIVMVADCQWPVEARFLIDCVKDAPETRTWEGPYPLHDVASVLMAFGLDPLETRERRENELPAHNPLHDARQSVRLLLEALSMQKRIAGLEAVAGDSLRLAMRDASEDFFCCGWAGGLEYSLWSAITNPEIRIGEFGGMPGTERATLLRLADLAGGWWARASGEPERFVPMAEWEALYSEWEKR